MDFHNDRCNRCRIKNFSVCKTLDPQVRPYKGRMLNSGKCKLGDNPVRANEAGSVWRCHEQEARLALEAPWKPRSDRGLFQQSTKGGAELGALCMLSVQNQSQHHSPVSGWHLTPTEVSLNRHCFKALLFLSSLRGSARAICCPSARCMSCRAGEILRKIEEK